MNPDEIIQLLRTLSIGQIRSALELTKSENSLGYEYVTQFFTKASEQPRE